MPSFSRKYHLIIEDKTVTGVRFENIIYTIKFEDFQQSSPDRKKIQEINRNWMK